MSFTYNPPTSLSGSLSPPFSVPLLWDASTPIGGGGSGNVILLLHFDGTNGQTTTVDSSLAANTVTMLSGTTLSTAQKEFGTASMALGPLITSNTGATVPTGGSGGLFDMGAGDFTYEFWFYLPSGIMFPSSLIGDGNGSSVGQFQVTLFGNGSTGINAILEGTGGGAADSPAVTTLGWHSVAVVRIGTKLTVYLDGIGGTPGTIGVGTPRAPSSTFTVGHDGTSANALAGGFIDEVRVTKGLGIYTSNYTPSGPLSPSPPVIPPPGYDIYRNGVSIHTFTGTPGYTDTVPGAGTYIYEVAAWSGSSDISDLSDPFTISVSVPIPEVQLYGKFVGSDAYPPVLFINAPEIEPRVWMPKENVTVKS